MDEAETLRVWINLTKHASTIVDVGANLGIYTLAACATNPNAIVHALEPVPEAAAQLRHNITINAWDGRAHVHETAAADRNGTARFHVPGYLSPMASLDPAGFRGKEGSIIDVSVGRLDDLLQNAGKIDLVKIDVEKFEPDVLQGMPRILASHRPSIIIECLADGPYHIVDAVLRDAGYAVFQLTQDGPVRAARIAPAEDLHDRFRNFLAVEPGSDAEMQLRVVQR